MGNDYLRLKAFGWRMKIKVFVQSCLMCLLDDLGIKMLRGQQPIQNIIYVCVCVFMCFIQTSA